jgi:hypothetical protein
MIEQEFKLFDQEKHDMGVDLATAASTRAKRGESDVVSNLREGLKRAMEERLSEARGEDRYRSSLGGAFELSIIEVDPNENRLGDGTEEIELQKMLRVSFEIGRKKVEEVVHCLEPIELLAAVGIVLSQEDAREKLKPYKMADSSPRFGSVIVSFDNLLRSP